MNRSLGPWMLAIVVALGLPVLLAWYDVPRQLGAHPWWTMRTAIIGAPIGLGLGVILLLAPRIWGTLVSVVATGGAFAVALYGGQQFAASFAEDAFAGKLWYFGWIGVAAGLSALAFALLAPRTRE